MKILAIYANMRVRVETDEAFVRLRRTKACCHHYRDMDKKAVLAFLGLFQMMNDPKTPWRALCFPRVTQ